MADPAFPVPEMIGGGQRRPGMVSLGDWAEMRLEPDLLVYLSTAPEKGLPIRGKSVHPMTGLPIGIGVDAAIKAADGKENGIEVLRALEVELASPIPQDEAVIARGEVISFGRRHVRCRMEVRTDKTERILLRGVAVLVKVEYSRAVDITSYLLT